MKKTLLAAALLVLPWMVRAEAQRVTLKKTGTLGEALAAISGQSGVSVIVSAEAAARKVTVDMSQVAGGEAVELAAQLAGASAWAVEGGLVYAVSGKAPSAEPSAQPAAALAPQAGGPELAAPVTLELEGAPLAAVGAQIGQAGKIKLSVDAKLLKERVSVYLRAAPLRDVLAALAKARGVAVKKGPNGYILKKR